MTLKILGSKIVVDGAESTKGLYFKDTSTVYIVATVKNTGTSTARASLWAYMGYSGLTDSATPVDIPPGDIATVRTKDFGSRLATKLRRSNLLAAHVYAKLMEWGNPKWQDETEKFYLVLFDKDCITTCQVQCQLDNQGVVCEVNAQVCEEKCEQSCQESCELSCQTSCERSCQKLCEVTCEQACEKVCQTECELSCQVGCQVSCEEMCEKNCQESCELSCQTGCEVTCEQTCEKACQIGCEETIQQPTVCETACEQPPQTVIDRWACTLADFIGVSLEQARMIVIALIFVAVLLFIAALVG